LSLFYHRILESFDTKKKRIQAAVGNFGLLVGLLKEQKAKPKEKNVSYE